MLDFNNVKYPSSNFQTTGIITVVNIPHDNLEFIIKPVYTIKAEYIDLPGSGGSSVSHYSETELFRRPSLESSTSSKSSINTISSTNTINRMSHKIIEL